MPIEKINDHLLNWASDLEIEARLQAERTSRIQFLGGPVALMPDAHWGMGSTVGSVIPTVGAIMPAAVGVDIGCGMIAANTGLHSTALPDDLSPLMPLIEDRIPAGVGRGHGGKRDGYNDREINMGRKLIDSPSYTFMDAKLRSTSRAQMGSLGSGNHFVEVCLDEEDAVWIVLHSGSRGVGNKLALRHIDIAKGLMKQWLIKMEDQDLSYLVEGTPEFDAYIADMLWAQDYALKNREVMMDSALASLWQVVRGDNGYKYDARFESPLERVNCHHNFTQMEHHHGRNMWITRKGAISARQGQRGVIPGSMGTASYIVEGLGSFASYQSSSHGAGRRMSRGRAHKELRVDDLRTQMEGKVWNEEMANSLLDEAPGAYKDIDQVMADQADLTRITHSLHQIFNYKGK